MLFALSLEGIGDPFPTHCMVPWGSLPLPCTVEETAGENRILYKGSCCRILSNLCNVFFDLKKKKKVFSSIFSWLRTVLDSLPSSSLVDAINQEMSLNHSYPFCCISQKHLNSSALLNKIIPPFINIHVINCNYFYQNI